MALPSTSTSETLRKFCHRRVRYGEPCCAESFLPTLLWRERCCHICQVYTSVSAFSTGRILPWGSQPTRGFLWFMLTCFTEIEHVRLKNTGNVYWQFLSHELNSIKPNVYFYIYKDYASYKNKDNLIGTIQSQRPLALLSFSEFLPLCKGISAVFANMKFVSALMLLKFCMTSDKLLCDLLPSGKKKTTVVNFSRGGTCALDLGKSQNQKYWE